MAQVTLRAQVAALTTLVESLVAAKGAPASAKAESPFLGFIHERAASKVACEIHNAKACNRRFTPASSGRTGHVARIV